MGRGLPLLPDPPLLSAALNANHPVEEEAGVVCFAKEEKKSVAVGDRSLGCFCLAGWFRCSAFAVCPIAAACAVSV